MSATVIRFPGASFGPAGTPDAGQPASVPTWSGALPGVPMPFAASPPPRQGGTGQPASAQASNSQAGSIQPGNSQVGSGQAGSAQAGDGRFWSAQAKAAHPGAGQPAGQATQQEALGYLLAPGGESGPGLPARGAAADLHRQLRLEQARQLLRAEAGLAPENGVLPACPASAATIPAGPYPAAQAPAGQPCAGQAPAGPVIAGPPGRLLPSGDGSTRLNEAVRLLESALSGQRTASATWSASLAELGRSMARLGERLARQEQALRELADNLRDYDDSLRDRAIL